jgi:hypothetical protein
MLSPAGTVAFSVNGQTIAGCTQRSLSMLAGATDAATAVCIAEVPAPTSASSVNYAATYHYPVNHLSGRTSEEAVVSVTVAASAAANYTDMWWAGPAENGWGVSITQHGDVQFVAIYVYNEGGKPIWYVMPGGTWNADRTAYTGDLYAPISAPFVAYDAARFRPNSPVGSATIAYGGAGTATLSYRIGGISGVKNLQRQLFAADDGQPKLQVNDLWWGGAEQNGWGVNIAQQGRVLFLVWYTYGNDGATTWYAMPGGTWSGTTYVGDLYRTVSSPWLGSAYLPTSFVATKVGTMTLDFADQNNAAMSYVVDGVVQTKMIVRQPY